jgi:hypothetical protein
MTRRSRSRIGRCSDRGLSPKQAAVQPRPSGREPEPGASIGLPLASRSRTSEASRSGERFERAVSPIPRYVEVCVDGHVVCVMADTDNRAQKAHPPE